jgi:hypothetical protein
MGDSGTPLLSVAETRDSGGAVKLSHQYAHSPDSGYVEAS